MVVIYRLYGLHRRVIQWREVSGSNILLDLLGILAARNGAAYGWEHRDPAQRQLGKCCTFWHERSQLLNGLQTSLVIHAGEGFAPIKRLAVAVEVAMIVNS